MPSLIALCRSCSVRASTGAGTGAGTGASTRQAALDGVVLAEVLPAETA